MGNVTRAAQASGIDRNTAYAAKDNDPKFAADWADAEKGALDTLEAEAYRRAVEGVQKPVFYQGEECGLVREYSDMLLTTLLKARAPEKYRENAKVEHSGSVSVPIEIIEVVKQSEGTDAEPSNEVWEAIEI